MEPRRKEWQVGAPGPLLQYRDVPCLLGFGACVGDRSGVSTMTAHSWVGMTLPYAGHIGTQLIVNLKSPHDPAIGAVERPANVARNPWARAGTRCG